MGYLGEAWRAYREHFAVLATLGIASVVLTTLLSYMHASILNAYVTLLLMIAAYKAVEGAIDWKKSAVQALWAWIAQMLVGIGLALAFGLIFVVAFMAALADPAVGIALGVGLVILVMMVFVRFIFIPYFAHRGYDLLDTIKKSWKRGWGPAITAGLEMLLIWTVGGLLALGIAFPAIKATITSVKTTLQSLPILMPKEQVEAAILNAAWATITAPENIGFVIAAMAVWGLFTPLAWLVVYFGAKEE